MTANATTELLTLDAVAAELSVSKTTVEKWVHDKDLASFKKGVGKKRAIRRVSREELTRFVRLNTVKPKRPDWLSAEVEGDFVKKLRELIGQEINAEAQRRGERIAA